MNDPFELVSHTELTRRRARLLARIVRKYQVRSDEYLIGPLRVRFMRVEDPDRVLDQICDEVDRIERTTGAKVPDQLMHMPYWAELWDSAFGIGQWLVKVQGSGFGVLPKQNRAINPSSLNPEPRTLNPSTLDLGCGMGFAGVVAAMLGHRVTFVDLETHALLFASLNSLPWKSHVRCRKLNWQTDALDEKYNLIIGADVLYERSQWEFLEPFFRAHLLEGGCVILGEPGRQTGDLFGDWIRARGWNLSLHEEPVTTRPRPIRLFEISL